MLGWVTLWLWVRSVQEGGLCYGGIWVSNHQDVGVAWLKATPWHVGYIINRSVCDHC